MNVLAISVVSVKARKHLIAVVAAWILIVSRSEFQCHCFLSIAGTPLVTGRCCQSRALVDQVESSKLSAENTGNSHFASRRLEVEALTVFKAAITSDRMGALKSWQANDSSVCGWAGVVCSPQQHRKQMHLITLNVSGNQLVGNLNSALLKLGNLLYLQQLDLSNNVFSGSIPGASISNCSKLSYLSLSNNQLTGPIPSQLGDLVNLKALNVMSNNLTGNIPESLGNCTLLTYLNLGSNFLDGEIPSSLGRLYALESLDLRAKISPVEASKSNVVIPVGIKSFSGSLPPALGNCSSLISLILADNSNLGGQLPQELGKLTKLETLEVFRCGFQGAPLSWLGNITSLSVLDLAYNEFQGEIPYAMGTLQNLIDLYLGGNNLTGVIPISITNCTLLKGLGMERNILTGDIPPQLGLLRKLEKLVLEDNSFTGILPSSLANCSALTVLGFGEYPFFFPQMIPSWMGSLVNLELLYLASMNLQGGIPEEIGRLSKLQMLDLDGNNLTRIPPSLANCTLLKTLSLNLNKLTGEIPPEIGLLTDLQDLELSNNFFIGSFPKFIANLSQIQQLGVSSNSLSGTIDVNFGGLQQLNRFTADGNYFIGSIPETLSNCSNLFQILLMNNSLTGEIPASFGNLTLLEELRLSGNKIGRMIPVDIARCWKLGSLDLSLNNMEGSIPPNIGQLFSLRYLDLNNNNFSGMLPSSLGNCSSIIVLDCSYNHFIGSLPWDILSMMSMSLTSLKLSHNFFSGYLSPLLSQLTNIQIIDVSANNISGSVPPSLGDCMALVSLDISINNLTGVIPQSIGRLLDLKFFNASYNNFEGPVPEFDVSKANLTNSSFLGNPLLCGIILGPQRECRNETSATSKSCNGFKCKQVWIPTASAGGGVLLIVVGALCWMTVICGLPRRKSNHHTHLMLNFASDAMRVSERDVLRIIDGGEENVIGRGAKSVVYRSVLSGGGEVFAVKTLHSLENSIDADESLVRENELLKEVHTLAKLRHRNVLKILSYCSSLDVKAIILEYMPEGSLHKHLYELGEACQLTWKVRLNIAMGTAEAMKYLHHGFPEPLIHRDLKPSNILLDANLEAKVADFGLSKSVGGNRDGEATASTFCGTIGYMPPEYATETIVSTKGDVYSYGVVLLELLVGRPPTSWDDFGPGNRSLQSSIIESPQEGAFELLDSTLKQEGIVDTHKKKQMMLLMRVALVCMRETPGGRPSMNDVVEILTKIENVDMEPEDLAKETTV